MSKRNVFFSAVVAWVLWSNCCVGTRSSDSRECPSRDYTNTTQLPLRNMGGMAPLVNSAESTRNVIVGGDLPYNFIGTRAREAYNRSRDLDVSMFVSEWTTFTQNALFVGGFVLFVGILLPGIAMALWTFCECCYEEDEEEEEENRNLTWQAQVVVWSLAIAVVAVVIVLIILVGMLLGANSWMAHGVERGNNVVRRTIPQLIDIKQSALQTLHSTLVTSYDNLTDALQTNILDKIPLSVSERVTDPYNSSVQNLTQKVTSVLDMRPRLLNLTHSLIEILNLSLPEPTSSLHQSLSLLQYQCSLFQDDNSSMLSLCQTDFLALVPPALWETGGGVSDDGIQSLLHDLQLELTDSIFSNKTLLPLHRFEEYIEKLTSDLALGINSTTGDYLDSLGTNLRDFTNEVTAYYNSALPLDSQPQVELYLGARHLDNWEWFRYALTVTFSLLFFIGSLCLLGALSRGLWNVAYIYHYSGLETAACVHGAHQAGLFIKKLAFSLSVVCLLSASFSGFFLSVAGVMGKVCGNHNNFSELLENVIDNPQTWSSPFNTHYPLSSVLLNMSHFPLKVASTLEDCRANVSLFHAFHLEQRYDLKECIQLHPQEKNAYRDEMQNVHLDLEPADLVSTVLKGQLNRLETAAQLGVELTEQTSHLVGLEELKQALENLTAAAAKAETSLNISTTVEAALNLTNDLQTIISAITRDASELQTSLSADLPLTPVLSKLATDVSLIASTNASLFVLIASENVTAQLDLFINSSITNLICYLGDCRDIATDYDTFAAALCGDIVPGMDLYWTLLLIILSMSILLMLLSLLLASRFVSLENTNHNNPKFYLSGAVMRQVHGSLWQVLSLAIYLWWVVYISQDELVKQEFCDGGGAGCCQKCIWAFGIVFILISVGAGGASRVYQYFTIYTIKKCTAMKYRRFWIERKKAVNFYGQLALFFLQDLPFLILVGVYAEKTFLNVPSFYSLSVALIGILTYLVYLIREGRNISTYWTWLKMELEKLGLGKKAYTTPDPLPPNANGNVTNLGRRAIPNGHHISVRSPYGSSGSEHSENSSQGTFQDHGFEFHPPRLSDIPEYPEGGLESGIPMVRVPSRIAALEPRLVHNDDRQTDSEMSEQHSQYQSRVRLDRDIEQDSDAYQQRHREALNNHERGGVEIARAHYHRRDMDTSTISDSYYFGSRNSMELQGYISSSQAPDTNSYYESSDCRDEDGDSVYSQARYRLPVPLGEVTVDV